MKLTSEPVTTISGLSEGIMWNFKKEKVAADLLKYYGIDKELLSPLVPTFGEQLQGSMFLAFDKGRDCIAVLIRRLDV